MNNNLTEIVAVIDESGSMIGVKDATIEGFNSFLNSQKALPGEANFTLNIFNTNVRKVYDRVPIKNINILNNDTYRPDGCTALYDAVGQAIDDLGVKLNATKEEDKPGKVIFVILTDGQENSSKEYNGNKIKDMIKLQRDTYSWEFIFLAAGEGAFDESVNLGMNRSKTIYYSNNTTNTKNVYDTITMYSETLRRASKDEYEAIKSSFNVQDSYNTTSQVSNI